MAEQLASQQELQSVKQDMKDLARDVRNLEMRTTVAERDIDGIKDDLRGIKSNTTWILRLIIGGLVMAALGLLLKGGA